MRLTLDALTVLDAIDRKGSFAAAGEELHRVPSAVTYAVQKLEEELGVALFDRSGHRARLTDAGRELLREGRHLLQAAEELEARVKRVATGYEVELRIAVDDAIPMPRLFPLFEEFYRDACGTRLKVLSEIYGGAWDALTGKRADLVIGAPGEGPAGGGFSARPIGTLEFVFMVAPTHPLASAREPLSQDDILKHRAVAAADSSRNLPPRTAGLLSGQDVLTLPGVSSKIEAQRYGLGVGYLPKHLARIEMAAGRLAMKRVLEPRADVPLYLAWRTADSGKALHWFLKRLESKTLLASFLA